jgi:H+/Cl- antiporter ClcA
MAYSAVQGGQGMVPTPKKMSTSMVILAACLLGIVVGLFGLNYWHTTRCADSKSPDEMEVYIEGINRRLLQAESQVSSELASL